jgi:hypothetical protein
MITKKERDELMAKRVRWENGINEEREYRLAMAEKLRHDMGEDLGSFGKKKQKLKKKDPFEGMDFVGVFGLPIARYAHDYMDEKPAKKNSKWETGI